MAATNGFKKIDQEDKELIPHAPKEVEHQVMGVVKTGHFAGNILELYLTKMIDLIMMLFGARKDENPSQEKKDDSSGNVR